MATRYEQLIADQREKAKARPKTEADAAAAAAAEAARRSNIENLYKSLSAEQRARASQGETPTLESGPIAQLAAPQGSAEAGAGGGKKGEKEDPKEKMAREEKAALASNNLDERTAALDRSRQRAEAAGVTVDPKTGAKTSVDPLTGTKISSRPLTAGEARQSAELNKDTAVGQQPQGKSDDFYTASDTLRGGGTPAKPGEAPPADIFSDPSKMAHFFREMSGQREPTIADQPLGAFGGGAREQDLRAKDFEDRQQANRDYMAARGIWGRDAAQAMSPEELRTNVRDYYASLNPPGETRSGRQIVSDAEAAGRINPTGASESQIGQARGSIVPAEPVSASTAPNPPLGYSAAAAPNQPGGPPNVAKMREMLSGATDFTSNVNQTSATQSAYDRAQALAQPAQPPQPLKNEEEQP